MRRILFAAAVTFAACGGQAVEQLTTGAEPSIPPTPLDSLCEAGIVPLDAGSPRDATPPPGSDAGEVPICIAPDPPDAALLAQIPLFPSSQEPGNGYRAVVITAGDSLTDEPANPYWSDGGAVDTSGPSTWVPTMRKLLGSDVHVVNAAHGGWLTSQMLTEGPQIDALYEKGKPFVVTIEGGANDVVRVGGSISDAGSPSIFDGVVDNLFAFCDARHAAHADAKCVILGPTFSSWYSIAGYDHYNARLRAEGAAHADAVVYFDQDPRLNEYRFSSGGLHVTYFYDQVHYNDNGSTAVAMAVLPVVGQIIRASVTPWP